MSQLAVREAITQLSSDGRDVHGEAVAVTLYNGVILKGLFRFHSSNVVGGITGSSSALPEVSAPVNTFFDLEDVVSFTFAERSQRIE